jgi:hypothetical protein
VTIQKCKLLHVLFLMLALGSTASASRGFVVTIDTSSLNGTRGAIEFQLNPGPGIYDDGAVTIEFLGLTQQPNPSVSGDVKFSPTFTMSNSRAFNDFFAGATFGSTMTVRLLFTGAMVDNPAAGRTAGTDFTLSLYKNEQGSTTALTNDGAGNALIQISFDPVAGIQVANNSASARIEQSMSAALRQFIPSARAPYLYAIAALEGPERCRTSNRRNPTPSHQRRKSAPV